MGRQRKWPEAEFWPGQLKLTALFLWKCTTGLIITIVGRSVMGWSTRNLVFVPNQGISSPQHYARAVAQYWLKHYNISQHLRVYMPAWHTAVSCFKLSKRNIHYCAWKVFAENHKQCNTHWEYSLTTRCGDQICQAKVPEQMLYLGWHLWDIYLPWWPPDTAPMALL